MTSPTTTSRLVERIREERLRLGWTQLDLASRAGVPLATYARFERTGRTNLTRLTKITAALGLKLVVVRGEGSSPAVPADPRLGPGRRRGLRRTRPSAATTSAVS